MSSSSDEHEADCEDLNLTENSTEHCREDPKTTHKYIRVYENFMLWKNNNAHYAQSISEEVLLTYFTELAEKYKPPSLYSIYSMLKTMFKFKNDLDISSYKSLISFLKTSQVGYTSIKAKEFTAEEIEKFLHEAPDIKFLAMKVVLIFGVTGACHVKEIHPIKSKDIKTYGGLLKVTIVNTNNKIPRSFYIEGQHYDIVKKYQSLRVAKDDNSRFFETYRKGKCIAQPIGTNTMGAYPKKIAKYLELPHPDSYNAHSFRRTAYALSRMHSCFNKYSVNKVTDEESPKHVDPIENKEKKIKIEKSNDNRPSKKFCLASQQNTISEDPLIIIQENEKVHPTSHPQPIFKYSLNNKNSVQVIEKVIKSRKNNVTFHFHNCTFNNMFNGN